MAKKESNQPPHPSGLSVPSGAGLSMCTQQHSPLVPRIGLHRTSLIPSSKTSQQTIILDLLQTSTPSFPSTFPNFGTSFPQFHILPIPMCPYKLVA